MAWTYRSFIGLEGTYGGATYTAARAHGANGRRREHSAARNMRRREHASRTFGGAKHTTAPHVDTRFLDFLLSRASRSYAKPPQHFYNISQLASYSPNTIAKPPSKSRDISKFL